jgi:hypothetical protein
MKIQTEGFVALGEMQNDEHHPCLVCGRVPDIVMVDLFAVAPKDVPPSITLPESKTLAVTYRLCPQCFKAKPDPWRIRLLILARLSGAR